MAKEGNNLTLFVTAAVSIILMVALITSIAQESNKVTSLQAYTDTINLATARNSSGGINPTNYTLTYPQSGWKTEYSDCAIDSSVVVKNGTGGTLALNTDYAINPDDTVYYKNTTSVNKPGVSNVSTISYNSCPDGYVSTSWGRSMLNNTSGFIALAILIVAIILAYQILGKEMD